LETTVRSRVTGSIDIVAVSKLLVVAHNRCVVLIEPDAVARATEVGETSPGRVVVAGVSVAGVVEAAHCGVLAANGAAQANLVGEQAAVVLRRSAEHAIAVLSGHHGGQ